MTALVLVDPSAHQDAVSWYGLRRPEPIGRGTLAIGQVMAVASYSLDTLLDAIIANSAPGSDLIIVGHGRESGLAAPLFPGSESRFRHEIAGALATDRETPSEFGAVPAMRPAEVASMAQIPEARVVALRAKMTLVRAKGLGHVAFRACKMGMWPNIMVAYKRFFACRAVSAPNVRDSYGHFTVSGPERNFDAWVSRHLSGRWHTFTYGRTPDRVAVATRGGEDDEHRYSTEVAAESASGFATWRAQQLTSGNFGRVLYHGGFNRVPLAGSKRLMMVGDSDYAGHIVPG